MKRRTIMTLFPESPSIIEKCSTPITGRRGRTNTGTSEITSIGTQPRRSVRLFQGRSSDNSDADEFVLPLTPTTKKQTATRTSRKNNKRTASEEDNTMVTPTKRSRRGGSSTADTTTTTLATSDGTSSNAIPVTPESSTSTPSGTRKTKSKSTTRKTKTTTIKTKTKKKTKTKTSASSASVWSEPDGWRDTYELVRELRKDKTAPCDSAGAEALVLPPIENENDNEMYAKTRRFQTLVALMLSSQTKDAMVDRAMGNLRATDGDDGGDGLTIASIRAIDPKVLNSKINMVGFHNNKTKYIKQVVEILHEKYDDDIPSTADEMIRNLPGIGPKMAYIIEPICWGVSTGIGVDTHMQRLFPKIGFVSPDVKNPEQTRKQLQSWLPHEYWGEVNLLWVGFGQEIQQEKQKSLKKALKSDRSLDALRLLRRCGFDVVKEFDKLLKLSSEEVDDHGNDDAPWTNDNTRDEMKKMVKEVSQEKTK